jgi:hypothetical protein
MSWINLGEVYYTIHRAAGGKEADATLAGSARYWPWMP